MSTTRRDGGDGSTENPGPGTASEDSGVSADQGGIKGNESQLPFR